MQATHTQFDIRALQASWQRFDSLAQLRPIHREADYARMVGMMNTLLDDIGDAQTEVDEWSHGIVMRSFHGG